MTDQLLTTVSMFLAFFVTLLLAWSLADPRSWLQVVDIPNERSLHDRPTPRTGGVAICSGLLSGSLVMMFKFSLVEIGVAIPVAMAIVMVGFVSYADDCLRLPVMYRLIAHIAAAVLLIYADLSIQQLSFPGFVLDVPVWSGVILTSLFVVWMINLYNFMDGIDGIAGGMAIVGFCGFASLGWLAGDYVFAAWSLVVAAAAAGFLVFNFPPARMFMGDTGSSTLGLLVAVFSLWGVQTRIFPLWIALLVFSPFIVDATVTLFRRAIRKERVWQAHKSHYYQRLVQLGWSHRRVVLWEYVVMIACAISALLAAKTPQHVQWTIIIVWGSVYTLFAFLVGFLENRRRLDS